MSNTVEPGDSNEVSLAKTMLQIDDLVNNQPIDWFYDLIQLVREGIVYAAEVLDARED